MEIFINEVSLQGQYQSEEEFEDAVKVFRNIFSQLHKNRNKKTVFKDKFMKVSKTYFDQVQLQMEVADLDKTHLVQHYIRMPGQPIKVHEIYRDKTWFAKNSDIFKRFVGEVRAYFPFDVEEFICQAENLEIYFKE